MAIFSIGSIEFREHRSSGQKYNETHMDGATSARRPYLVSWDRRFEAVNALMGYTERGPTSMSVKIGSVYKTAYLPRRIPPHKHPERNLFCLRASVVGSIERNEQPSATTTLGSWVDALIDCEYGDLPYEAWDDSELGEIAVSFPDGVIWEAGLLRYINPKIIPGGRYQTIPRMSGLAFYPEKTPVVHEAFIMLPENDLVIEWHDVPAMNIFWDGIRDCIGKTNRTTFGSPSSLVGSFPPRTLVMGAPDYRIYKRRGTNQFYCTVIFRMRHHINGVDYLYNWMGNPPGYHLVTRSGQEPNYITEANLLYKSADFNALFYLR